MAKDPWFLLKLTLKTDQNVQIQFETQNVAA